MCKQKKKKAHFISVYILGDWYSYEWHMNENRIANSRKKRIAKNNNGDDDDVDSENRNSSYKKKNALNIRHLANNCRRSSRRHPTKGAVRLLFLYVFVFVIDNELLCQCCKTLEIMNKLRVHILVSVLICFDIIFH